MFFGSYDSWLEEPYVVGDETETEDSEPECPNCHDPDCDGRCSDVA